MVARQERQEGRPRVGIGAPLIRRPKEPVIAQFSEAFTTTMSRIAGARGTLFDSLSRDEQIVLEMQFLQEYADVLLDERRATLLARGPTGLEPRTNPMPIEVNPNLIEVAVRDSLGNEFGMLRLGSDRKLMLAFAAGLTQAKLNRFLDPWFTREELTQASEGAYSEKQFHTHLLLPLERIGILERNMRWGSRLACNPDDIVAILRSVRPRHELVVSGFDQWRHQMVGDTVLFKQYQIPLVVALYEQYVNAPSPDADLDVSKLSEASGLTLRYLYSDLRKLGEQGVVTRRNERYRLGDINASYIAAVKSWKEPIVVSVHAKGIEMRRPTIGKRTESLNVTASENPVFPRVSWADSRVHTTPVDIEGESLSYMRAVLATKLSIIHSVIGRDAKLVYRGRLSLLLGVDDAVVFGILDFLGIGPEEMRRLDTLRGAQTLVEQIRRLESSNKLADQLLFEEVKARLARAGEVFLDEIFPHRRKTAKMLEVEARIGIPIERYLRLRHYKGERGMEEIEADLRAELGADSWVPSWRTIAFWMQRLDIQARSPVEGMTLSSRTLALRRLQESLGGDPKKVLRRMVDEGMTLEAIAKKAKRKPKTIRPWLRRFEIETPRERKRRSRFS